MSKDIKGTSEKLGRVFSRLIEDVPSFQVLDKIVLPYGLKPHTRSICWLAEQVILQNVKMRIREYKIKSYADPDSDISAWDARLELEDCDAPCYINIKVSDVTRPVRRNDIASVKKLIGFYEEHPSALLYYVVIMLEFSGNQINFKRLPIVRYYPWIGDFVVNSRNHHIQSVYETPIVERSTEDFIKLVKSRAGSRGVL